MLWTKFRQSLLGEKIRSLVPNNLVNLLEHLPLAVFAVLYFRYPARNLRVIGVTGTDGKTTTASLIHAILLEDGRKAALVSTVGAKIGHEEIDTGLHVTSPDPWALQRLLRKIVDMGFKDVVLESTSHGLIQNRLFGCNFKVGVITNVTHEHLDYHKTYQNYLHSKTKLFNHVQGAILNRDDESFAYLSQRIKKTRASIITYGLDKNADFNPQTFKFCPQLIGEHNQYNCLAAAATASFLGIDLEIVKKALEKFKGVKGRMEEIKAGQDFKIFVDFAHTPNSLTNVLKTLKKMTPKDKKLIAIFGSAGLRDQTKRPIMGENAAKYADTIVLTADDPRTEDVNEIINEIASGCSKMGFEKDENLFFVPDRQKALEFALEKLAKKGDILAFCGKGHEKSICYGKIDYPWSDQEEIKKILKKK